MTIRIWHQSFTVLEQLPAYAEAMAAHFRRVARPDTEVVMHGMHPSTYRTNYPGSDIKHSLIQALHANQFVMGGIAAEREGFDVYAIMTLPEPALVECRALLDIPVVAYGESAMLTATMLGRTMGVLMFIGGMEKLIAANCARMGLSERFIGAEPVGFGFNDVLAGYSDPVPLIARFIDAARKMIARGAEVIIPGEAPLCLLLARSGLNDVDGVPVLDSLACTIKMAEAMVELRRTTGVRPCKSGYFGEQPPRDRIEELLKFYGIADALAIPGSQGNNK